MTTGGLAPTAPWLGMLLGPFLRLQVVMDYLALAQARE